MQYSSYLHQIPSFQGLCNDGCYRGADAAEDHQVFGPVTNGIKEGPQPLGIVALQTQREASWATARQKMKREDEVIVIVVKTVMVTGKGSDKSNVKQCSSQAAGAFPCSSPMLQNAAILRHYSNKKKRLCERRRERKMSREREKHCVGFNWLLYELANRFCCDSLISTVVMIFLSAVNTPSLNLLLLLLNSETEWLTGRWCVYMSVFVSSDTVHLIRRVIWPC